jgi:hypothetical protein
MIIPAPPKVPVLVPEMVEYTLLTSKTCHFLLRLGDIVDHKHVYKLSATKNSFVFPWKITVKSLHVFGSFTEREFC